MASLNRVMLIGNAGRDAELRFTEAGRAQATFSLAVSDKAKDREERTEWFNVVMWGDLAERLSEYITKGKPIYVEGRLQTRSWEKDGAKQYRTEVVANQIQLLGSNDGGDRRQQKESDDELPFD